LSCLSVRKEELGSQLTKIYEISYVIIFRKSVEKFKESQIKIWLFPSPCVYR
jgi:hypothetical protein